MKFFLCTVLLAAISLQVILCDSDTPHVERAINKVVQYIVRRGVNKGVLPGGPYFADRIIRSSVGPKKTSLIVDVKALNNQARVTVSTTILNQDLIMMDWNYNYTLKRDSKALTAGWAFSWLNYAAPSDSQFCNTEWYREYWCDGVTYTLDNKSLALDSPIKRAYDLLLDRKSGYIGQLDPSIPSQQPILSVSSDYICVKQEIGQEPFRGGMSYRYYVTSVYQPCIEKSLTFVNEVDIYEEVDENVELN